MAEQIKTLAGKTVTFVYGSEERTVEVESVDQCANGNTVVVGKDYNRNMAYRSFDVNKMSNINIK